VKKRTYALASVAVLATLAAGAAQTVQAGAMSPGPGATTAAQAPMVLPGGYKHLVVIYEENHSFDNLYGLWGSVNGQPVDGLADATNAAKTQVGQDGTPLGCLPQADVNLAAVTPQDCSDAGHGISATHFVNAPYSLDDYIHPDDKTCPPETVFAPNGVLKDSPGAEEGGCTRDLVHRFYQEQYQIDGGRMDRYTTGSDAVGLTHGYYDTTQLPIYRYLHTKGAPKYVVADHFFQGAFGGSFLNHQFLIAARAPLDTSQGASGAVNSRLDANGMPTSYPLYHATGTVVDKQLTQKCADPTVNDAVHACGDFAVNTIQPASAPHAGGATLPLIDDAQYPNIGDELSSAGISWNWYSGGWDDAVAGHPGPLFQYHHQPFNYYAAYAPGQPGRAHLQDETRFIAAAKGGTLPTVSFVKPRSTVPLEVSGGS